MNFFAGRVKHEIYVSLTLLGNIINKVFQIYFQNNEEIENIIKKKESIDMNKES